MAVEPALQDRFARLRGRLTLPECLPPLGTRSFYLFRTFWMLAFLLALVGPIAGTWDRFANPAQNSGLMPGSRAGIVVAQEDATHIRFPVGPVTTAMGITRGDRIVAVNAIPVSGRVDVSDAAIADGRISDSDYAAFAEILYGTEATDQLIRIRSADGAEREVLIRTGEQHIEAGAAALGIAAWMLRIVDLLHLATYPFLLAAAWILHRRKPRDAVNAMLSLAILLTMATEQPAAGFLDATLGVPRPVHAFFYDLGNICLLAGILLFPHGRFAPRWILLLLAALPVLMLLKGDLYRGVFMAFMFAGVLMLVRRLGDTAAGASRQQIKWALFGFTGYAIFLATSLVSDMLKPAVGAFPHQLLLETLAGLAMGLAYLSLQLGLLVALLCYRLYDAEVVISRSATFALVTIVLGASFAGVMEGIQFGVQAALGQDAGAGAAAVLGAAVATVLISPVHQRIQGWAEGMFHKNLLQLRRELPECVRDLREVADLPELLQEVLARVRRGVRTVRAAVIVEGQVREVSGVSVEEASRWLEGFTPGPVSDEKIECDRDDPIFPVRVPLCSASTNACLGWLVVGPRPDGTSIGEDEREVLVEVADPVSRAVRIVLKRDSQEREVAELLDSHRRRLDELEARLGQAAPVAPLPFKAANRK